MINIDIETTLKFRNLKEWITNKSFVPLLLEGVGLEPAEHRRLGGSSLEMQNRRLHPAHWLRIRSLTRSRELCAHSNLRSTALDTTLRLDHLHCVLRMTNAQRINILCTCRTKWFRYQTYKKAKSIITCGKNSKFNLHHYCRRVHWNPSATDFTTISTTRSQGNSIFLIACYITGCTGDSLLLLPYF